MLRVSRIIEEYVLWTDAVEYSIKGRIVEHVDEANANQRYGWEVSHHYGSTQTYYPSSVDGASIEEVRGLMLGYLRNFQNTSVEPDPHY